MVAAVVTSAEAVTEDLVPKNFYLVSARDCDYDEFSDFVWCAESEEEALTEAGKKFNSRQGPLTIVKLVPKDTETGEVLGSFHAG